MVVGPNRNDMVFPNACRSYYLPLRGMEIAVYNVCLYIFGRFGGSSIVRAEFHPTTLLLISISPRSADAKLYCQLNAPIPFCTGPVIMESVFILLALLRITNWEYTKGIMQYKVHCFRPNISLARCTSDSGFRRGRRCPLQTHA